MDDTLLAVVQREQFRDKPRAEGLLLGFLQQHFALDVAAVELRPLAVSLNSFNGIMTLTGGRRLFFKTHIEPDSEIDEYYNSSSLAAAGYPVIQPLHSSTESGRQLLIYEVVDEPTVFDVAWGIENGDAALLPALTAAQNASDRELVEIYRKTLEFDAPETASAPVHQLFHHRLAGPRFRQFYPDSGHIALPGGPVGIADLFAATWEINGQRYAETLADMITRSVGLLKPAATGPSVVGHGDAHNGNVFLYADPPHLVYFDPAFAGRHDPLLDLTKPIFHNVFAMWMYYPNEIRQRLDLSFTFKDGRAVVEHDFRLPPVRQMFLDSKISGTLIPILRDLKSQGRLADDWRQHLKAALLCCPLLTMNLADGNKFPPEISALGLAFAVEMGGESHGERSVIDQALDTVADSI